jgi:hypothetical protein
MAETSILPVREELRRIAEALPEDATWADAAHLFAMHQRLAEARQQSAVGRTTSQEDVEKEFGLTD